MKAVALALLLAGCASPTPSPVVPVRLQVCPDAAPAPVPPSKPRTMESILTWSIGQANARAKDQTALAECRQRLEDLNIWIGENVQ